MKSFDDWFNENFEYLCTTKDSAYEAYKEGQQSRQAEIDDLVKRNIELHKRIDEAVEILEYNEYVDSPSQALDILKGKNND